MSQITTHILDTAKGKPAVDVPVRLYQQINRQVEHQWQELARGCTDTDGRISDMLSSADVLPAGLYRLHFAVAGYFEAQQQAPFFPYVDIVFHLDAGGAHYHVPLLLSGYAYSTYRGS